jgi:hypothetical protein
VQQKFHRRSNTADVFATSAAGLEPPLRNLIPCSKRTLRSRLHSCIATAPEKIKGTVLNEGTVLKEEAGEASVSNFQQEPKPRPSR